MARKVKPTPYSMAKVTTEGHVMSVNTFGMDDRVVKALPKKIEALVKASDPSAVGRKSRNKGGTFERSVAKKLNDRFKSRAEYDASGKVIPMFTRTPRSGGFLSNQQKSQLMAEVEESVRALSGDLIAPKAFRFNLELKNYKNAPLLHKLFTKEGDKHMNEWLDQAKRDVVNDDMYMIIFHIDLIGDFCVFSRDALDYKTEPGDETDDKINTIVNTSINSFGFCDDAVLVPFGDLLKMPDLFFFKDEK